MKLLLTSAGISNAFIKNALAELIGKKFEDTSLVFIPTASNAEKGDKSWLIDDLVNLKKLNFKSLDIADISAVDEKIWRPKFEEADILFFEGGSTYYLMEWIEKSGLAELLPEFLETKIYVGVSAGSMVTNPTLNLKDSQIIYEEDFDRTQDVPALNLVNFYLLPHLNSLYFTKVREENIREAAQDTQRKIYALDDNSALKVIDEQVEVISEGKWFVVNE